MDNINSEFRLWISTYPISTFPVTVLSGSVKITNEQPHGIRSSMLQSFSSELISNPEFFNSVTDNSEV